MLQDEVREHITADNLAVPDIDILVKEDEDGTHPKVHRSFTPDTDWFDRLVSGDEDMDMAPPIAAPDFEVAKDEEDEEVDQLDDDVEVISEVRGVLSALFPSD